MFQKVQDLISDHHVNSVDYTAGGLTLAAFAKWLPEITAGLTGVWVILRIIVLIRDEFINYKGKQDGSKRTDNLDS